MVPAPLAESIRFSSRKRSSVISGSGKNMVSSAGERLPGSLSPKKPQAADGSCKPIESSKVASGNLIDSQSLVLEGTCLNATNGIGALKTGDIANNFLQN